MSDNLTELENILSEELNIFNQILRLEQEKSDAIISKDGTLMQKLSQEQEQYLDKINPLEETRKKLIKKYLKEIPDQNITLKDIALSEGAPGSPLVKTGDELKRTLDKIKSLQETNTIMIKDNLEFFSKIVNELKDYASVETGYSEKGTKKGKTVNPFLLDKKI